MASLKDMPVLKSEPWQGGFGPEDLENARVPLDCNTAMFDLIGLSRSQNGWQLLKTRGIIMESGSLPRKQIRDGKKP
jgi:hypothetical protein